MQNIVLSGVGKQYRIGRAGSGTIAVLGGVSIKANKGEFVGILGPNGCGKSTLLKLILGVEKPNTGVISIFGKSPEETRTGYVPQHTAAALYPWFTAAENVAFANPRPIGKWIDAASAKLCEFGLGGYANAYPYQLSGGMKQLVAIARATTNSAVFLLDEPLNGLDYQNRVLVEQALLNLRDGKNTAMVVSHDFDSTILLCDKIVVLSEKPAKVRAVVPVGLPAKRDLETRFSKNFGLVQRQIFKIMQN